MYNNVFKKCRQLKNASFDLGKSMQLSHFFGLFFAFQSLMFENVKMTILWVNSILIISMYHFLTKHLGFVSACPTHFFFSPPTKTFLTRGPDLWQRSVSSLPGGFKQNMVGVLFMLKLFIFSLFATLSKYYSDPMFHKWVVNSKAKERIPSSEQKKHPLHHKSLMSKKQPTRTLTMSN